MHRVWVRYIRSSSRNKKLKSYVSGGQVVLAGKRIVTETTKSQNRLLQMIRTQQAQLQQIQQSTGALPATSTAAVDDSTPTSERSFSFPNVSGPLPTSVINPRPRSPGPRGSLDLSRHSSRRSRHSSRTTSPALLPLSAGLQGESNEWLLSGGGSSQGSRDESAFYQAETQMLTRENLMLRMRIRELGGCLPRRFDGRKNCR